MREFFKMFFASLLAMVVASVIVVGLFVALIVSLSKTITEKSERKTSGDVLVIDVSKRIHEQGQNNSIAVFSKGNAYEAGLYDIVHALSVAKKDNAIKGVLLKLSPSPNQWATMQQLHVALEDFRSSGKFIYAYGEVISQGAYYLATSADSIYVNPAGDVELKGFATTLAFFKGTLDKLEIEPEIFYAGKFKSATEPFRTDKMSEPNKVQVSALQNSMWGQFLHAAAAYTHKDAKDIDALAQSGAIQFPSDAAKNGLVAGLLYWDQVEQRIRAKTGRSAKEEIKYVTINDYAADNKSEHRTSENRIAVIYAEGGISDGEQKDEHEIASKTICEEIRKARDNDKVKAVVLRVNSPGGSALASEVILRELELLREKKNLVVSMGDFAASGGYYISCMADSIFAMPTTITGSIGVFGMMFSMDKMLKDKLGVTFDGVKNAPYADLPTTFRPLTPAEGQRMQNSVDTIYDLFKSHVAAGRKRRMTRTDVDSIAQGRVWTGADALQIGLVDAMGGLGRAIASAAAMAHITDYKVTAYPESTDKLDALMRRINANTESSLMVKKAIREELGEENYQWYERLQSLRSINGKVMTVMPFVPSVN